MIDVRLLRENPELFYESCRKRMYGKEIVDEFLDLDSKWREMLKKVNDLKHEKNELSRSISSKIKEGLDVSDTKKKVVSLNGKISELEDELKGIVEKRDSVAGSVPNLLHDTVPVCKGDENNQFVRFSGTAKVYRDDLEYFQKNSGNSKNYVSAEIRPLSHVDLEEQLNIVDLERASKVAGSRFYYLKNRLYKLELALINYAVDFLSEKGFSVVEPPFMMNFRSLNGSTDLETFKDAVYKIEGEDLYLISTSEHPIASMLQDEILEEKELPVRVGGVSPCFRKEAGAHGKDTKGIFRVHQFFKIEQFIFCKEEDSWDFLEELISNAEHIFRQLEIPYRIVNVCSGELSVLNAKKYDLEGWFPAQGKFRELVSASNNTDYQGRSLSIRWRSKDGNKPVNTLNSTAIATTRTLVAIMENFQLKDEPGFSVPKALVPYTGFDTVTV